MINFNKILCLIIVVIVCLNCKPVEVCISSNHLSVRFDKKLLSNQLDSNLIRVSLSIPDNLLDEFPKLNMASVVKHPYSSPFLTKLIENQEFEFDLSSNGKYHVLIQQENLDLIGFTERFTAVKGEHWKFIGKIDTSLVYESVLMKKRTFKKKF